MKKYPKLTEENLEKIINKLLGESSIKENEKEVLRRYIARKDLAFMKKISDLKKDIVKIQITSGLDSLSKEMLELYTEIMRQYPSTGPSSIFNGLIK